MCDDCVPICRFGDKSPLFCSFFACQPFVWLGTSRKPALSQEWCQNVGVIADEAGVAVEAIKAWGKELMGWWLGWGFERKGRYLSYAINVCVYSQRTWIWGRNQRRGCTCKLTTYILHVIRPAPKCPLGWSFGTSVKRCFSIYFAILDRLNFQQTRTQQISNRSTAVWLSVKPVCQKKGYDPKYKTTS